VAKSVGANVEAYPRNRIKDGAGRWMTELSNWGTWGRDDQAGAGNPIAAAKRKSAARPTLTRARLDPPATCRPLPAPRPGR
jgi:hypothetical protein